ncbi:MAG: hypothetical protein MJZ38_01020 [archaeon]|nr:hypothetical protein [archaeon]
MNIDIILMAITVAATFISIAYAIISLTISNDQLELEMMNYDPTSISIAKVNYLGVKHTLIYDFRQSFFISVAFPAVFCLIFYLVTINEFIYHILQFIVILIVVLPIFRLMVVIYYLVATSPYESILFANNSVSRIKGVPAYRLDEEWVMQYVPKMYGCSYDDLITCTREKIQHYEALHRTINVDGNGYIGKKGLDESVQEYRKNTDLSLKKKIDSIRSSGGMVSDIKEPFIRIQSVQHFLAILTHVRNEPDGLRLATVMLFDYVYFMEERHDSSKKVWWNKLLKLDTPYSVSDAMVYSQYASHLIQWENEYGPTPRKHVITTAITNPDCPLGTQLDVIDYYLLKCYLINPTDKLMEDLMKKYRGEKDWAILRVVDRPSVYDN